MKKALLTLLMSLFAGSLLLGQSLALSWDGVDIHDGDSIYVYGEISDDMWYEIQAHAVVTNMADDPVEVKVKRNIIDTVPGTRNQFCWVLCYGFDVNDSFYSVELEPGESSSNSEFSGHYQPLRKSGTSIIEYIFYNVDNEDDQVSMKVFYTIHSLALSWDGADIHNGDSIYVYGEISDDIWYEIQAHAVVTNMADDPVEVKVKRNIIDTVAGTRNQFCWVLCYGFDVNDSFYSVELEPGESSSNSEFSGHYQPLGKSGTSIIEYIFYNVDNEDDQVSMKVFYTIHAPSASLELSWDGENIPNGDTVYVYGEISEDMWYEIQAHAIVTNVSEDTVEVKAQRIIIDTVPGTKNQFCWVLCYAYETNESSYSVTLDPGASSSDTEFSGHYLPYGQGGTSKIRYKFFNVDNEQDTVSMTVFYVVSPASIADLQSGSSFGSAYPNPAREIVSFDYEFSPTVNEARLIIYNMLGKQVMDYPVNRSNGKISVPLHELNEGVYFYTFLINGTTASTTRKLVVQR